MRRLPGACCCTSLVRPRAFSSLRLPATPPARSAVAASGSGNARTVKTSLPKPSLFKLWQIFMDLWNDACQRHGLRRLVPLDPLGLFVAAQRHRDLLQRQVRSQLGLPGRVVAAAPLGTEVEPDVLDGAAGQGAAGEGAGGQGGEGQDGVQEDAKVESQAALRAAGEASEGGAGPRGVVGAGVAAAAEAAAAFATKHHSPVVGKTPTGATIHEPAAPGRRRGRGQGPGAAGGPGDSMDVDGAGGGGGGAALPDLRDPDVLIEVGRGGAGAQPLSGQKAAVLPNGALTDQWLGVLACPVTVPILTWAVPLPQELIVATNYARGAYGYPMAAGGGPGRA